MLSYLLHRDILKYFEHVQQCCIFVRFMAWLHVSKAGFCTSVSNKFAIGFRMALREKYIILSRKCFNDIRITSNRSFFLRLLIIAYMIGICADTLLPSVTYWKILE